VWDEDVRLFRLAHINIATLPVFSWAYLQPDETHYNFGWLDEIVNLLWSNGVRVCMATSTAAHPAWLARRYPDVLRVDFQGRKRRFGMRHNSCPNSPTYRTYAPRLAGALAERYREHPALVLWHVSNEFGGACYCDNCAAAFRVWLHQRYGCLAEVNERWYTRFWGHTYYDWDEIVPPNALSEQFHPEGTAFQGISLDYARFMSDSILACYRLEYDVLKQITPEVPVTTNLMGTYKPLDYFAWAPYLDVISWDSYPSLDTDPAEVAFRHDLMRGLKRGQPFVLMEQTPSQQNWQAYNSLKRPGVMRLQSYQAVAHGADAVMFFQLRQSRGSCEKYHGAVISHAGHENVRVFREVAELGGELERLGEAVLDGRIAAEVAILFDWENWWAVEFSSGPSVDLKYVPQVLKYYRALWKRNTPVDVVGPQADLDRYKLVIAPLAYLLRAGFAARVERFVRGGGTFVTTFFSGMVDENDLVVMGGYPAELRKVLGLWVEEYDAPKPDQRNEMALQQSVGDLKGSYQCGLLCAIMHLEGAQAIAAYGRDFYAGQPALTRNQFGKGTAWYIGSDPEPALVEGLLAHLCAERGIKPALVAPPGVEVTQRRKGDQVLTFLLNNNEEAVTVDFGDQAGREVLTGKALSGRAEIPGRGVWIVRRGG
jgi:beta-galactosidase